MKILITLYFSRNLSDCFPKAITWRSSWRWSSRWRRSDSYWWDPSRIKFRQKALLQQLMCIYVHNFLICFIFSPGILLIVIIIMSTTLELSMIFSCEKKPFFFNEKQKSALKKFIFFFALLLSPSLPVLFKKLKYWSYYFLWKKSCSKNFLV